LLIASAVHFVVYIDNSSGTRRVASVREVVDCDGTTMVSNEIFRWSDGDETPSGFPMREQTRELLSRNGYVGTSEIGIRQ
jgi:hypothetical protein